jgi:hypothetical protein
MAAMIRLSSSVRGARTGEPDVFFAVMLHVVPLAAERIKPFFREPTPENLPRRVQPETGLDRFREGGSRIGLGTINAPRLWRSTLPRKTAHWKHCCRHGLSDFWRCSKLTLIVHNVPCPIVHDRRNVNSDTPLLIPNPLLDAIPQARAGSTVDSCAAAASTNPSQSASLQVSNLRRTKASRLRC